MRSAVRVDPEQGARLLGGAGHVIHAGGTPRAAAGGPGSAGSLDETRHQEHVVSVQIACSASGSDGAIDVLVVRAVHPMLIPARSRRDKGSARRWAGFTVALALFGITGCGEPEDASLDRMLEIRGRLGAEEQSRIAARVHEIAGASAAHAGPPIGYPEGFPLVPGYEVISGAVDRGVVATATLAYELDPPALADALVARCEDAGYELGVREVASSGTIRLRFERTPSQVSVAIRADGMRSMLNVIQQGRR
jgi:hypothetical protein